MSNPFTVKPGDVIAHFKRDFNTPQDNVAGKYLYQVLCIGNHTETGEPMMVYQALYAPYAVWVRPLSMVYDPVDKEKYPRAVQEYRFKVVNKEEL